MTHPELRKTGKSHQAGALGLLGIWFQSLPPVSPAHSLSRNLRKPTNHTKSDSYRSPWGLLSISDASGGFLQPTESPEPPKSNHTIYRISKIPRGLISVSGASGGSGAPKNHQIKPYRIPGAARGLISVAGPSGRICTLEKASGSTRDSNPAPRSPRDPIWWFSEAPGESVDWRKPAEAPKNRDPIWWFSERKNQRLKSSPEES